MLPTYDKTKRKKNFEALPKGAYVIKIMNAVEKPTKNNNGTFLEISFDIAEGEYAGYYEKQYKANTNEDKKWSYDAVYGTTGTPFSLTLRTATAVSSSPVIQRASGTS